MEFLTHTFRAPSGVEYTIREQNGQDEEVLTNTAEVNKGMNITNFLQGIIMSSSKKNGKLSIQEVKDIPLLDRNALILQSRIFSIGQFMDFTYKWPMKDDPEKFEEFEYTQDLGEYLFSDYNPDTITPEEMEEKPKAVPFYPPYSGEMDGDFLVFTLASGKRISFKRTDGNAEIYLLRLRESDKTRNTDFFMRNLRLEVDGKWERVSNFSLFSVKDMREMRKLVNSYDPVSNLTTVIQNPNTNQYLELPILAMQDFFFPEEDV